MNEEPHQLLTRRIANIVREHQEISDALESILDKGVSDERTKAVEVVLAVIEDQYPVDIYHAYLHIYDAVLSYDSIQRTPSDS